MFFCDSSRSITPHSLWPNTRLRYTLRVRRKKSMLCTHARIFCLHVTGTEKPFFGVLGNTDLMYEMMRSMLCLSTRWSLNFFAHILICWLETFETEKRANWIVLSEYARSQIQLCDSHHHRFRALCAKVCAIRNSKDFWISGGNESRWAVKLPWWWSCK